MVVGNLNLAEKWERLVTQGRFARKQKDENLDIEYGVQTVAPGKYGFYVCGKERGRSVSEKDFINERDEGIFQKQFNRLRKLRPGGHDRKPGRQDDLPAGVEKCGFYCQDPTNPLSLLVRPLLGSVSSVDCPQLHFNWNVYPNLAPFEPGGHFLLVPSAIFPELPHFPQLLTRFLFDDFFSLCKISKKLIVFFNSRHAGASQDHFHLQAVFHASKLPIENAKQSRFGSESLKHIGGVYPINAIVYTNNDRESCWQHIENLQTNGIPYNVIFLNGRVFLVPRDINNEIVREFPNLLASMEIAGKFIIADKEAFEKATEERIRVGLGRICLALDDIASVINKSSPPG